MMNVRLAHLLPRALVAFSPAIGRAAPPTLEAIYPPGGQCGQTVEVAVAGTFDRWPVGVWVDGQGVEAKAGKERGKVFVTVAADAAPGARRLRLYDEEGASVVRPFVIGVLPE